MSVKDRVATEANGWPGPRVIVDEADRDRRRTEVEVEAVAVAVAVVAVVA